MALIERLDTARKLIRTVIDGPRATLRAIADGGWENLTTGHGTSRDKRYQSRIRTVPPTVDHATLDDLYAGDDIAAKIADKPAEDMIRKWFRLSVTDEQVAGASSTEIADRVLQDLGRLEAKTHLKQALTWARVYGGALVFIGADEGGGDATDLAAPLDLTRVREVKYLEVYDRYEVTIATRYSDDNPGDLANVAKLGQPKTYTVQSSEPGRSSIDQQQIHESRFLRFDGPPTARRRRNRNDGWNDSVYTRLSQILADFGISWGSTANLLADFSQAVFKMKGLGEAIASDESSLVLDRMAIMDTCRSTVRAIPIDADDEDWMRQQTPVSGLPELLEAFMFRMAAAARMPVTVLFGRSPAGMNATGESDLSIWYDQVESLQETELRPRLNRLLEVTMSAAQGPTGGVIPESWEFTFNPLWQLSQTDETTARKAQAETDQIYIANGVVTPDEIADSRFGGEVYSFETSLDDEQRAEDELLPPDPEPFARPEVDTEPLAPPGNGNGRRDPVPQ